MRYSLAIVLAAAMLMLTETVKATPPSEPATGRCVVLIWVRFTGQVQVAQVVKSAGGPRLDEACIKAVLNQTMRPASRDGMVVDAWVTLPIVWALRDTKGHAIPPVARDGNSPPIPTLAGDQALNLDPPYDPRSPADQHLEAICGLHVRIEPDGVVDGMSVVQTCGSAALDQASMDALYAANFTPAQEDGKPVAGESDIWMAWGNPRPVTLTHK